MIYRVAMIVSLLSLLMESLSALFACYVREIHTKLFVDIDFVTPASLHGFLKEKLVQMITQLFLSMKSFLMQLPKERFSNLKLDAVILRKDVTLCFNCQSKMSI